jgi:putative restriction endonuclease
LLEAGFELQDEQIRLVGPQGIFKPRVLALPLTITTAAGGPYNDAFRDDGLLSYRYRGTDPAHRDNVGLRTCMQDKVPLVYFHGIGHAHYVPSWPVYIVGDDPGQLTFTVAVDDNSLIRHSELSSVSGIADEDSVIRRGYVTALARRRIHQQAFRERVINAYRQQCALCRLKHEVLLDAAHIIPDSDPDGVPETSNGISLCKLHHAAFDKHFLGIRPDFVIEIRKDLLEETDGPMLKHGLQGLHQQSIVLPRDAKQRPSTAALTWRFEKFQLARKS